MRTLFMTPHLSVRPTIPDILLLFLVSLQLFPSLQVPLITGVSLATMPLHDGVLYYFLLKPESLDNATLELWLA